MKPVAWIEGPYPQKFAVPRQSGLAPSAEARLRMAKGWGGEALRGLDAFSHLWLIFEFHLVEASPRALVRPPRLGGNARVGVFASRSPTRPNRIGLSLVELVSVEDQSLLVRGADLVDGTPIWDIKPYLPFADRVEGARSPYSRPTPIPVSWHPAVRQAPSPQREVIEDSLRWDPRPAYHRDPGRLYWARVAGWELSFRCGHNDQGTNLRILTARRLEPGDAA